MKNIFQKIVLISGILNFPIALGLMIPALINPNPETLITTVVLGAFMMFAGASLIWAYNDINQRASLVVWNGIVRLIGVCTVIYTASISTVGMDQMLITTMDFLLFLIFTIGSVKFTGKSFVSLLLGKN